MGCNLRHFLHSMAKLPSIHYVYLSTYPVTKTTEQKEMNILRWIHSPVIFVMRGPVCLKGVSELLSQGDGIIFDYEISGQIRTIQLAMLLQKPFVSPGVLSFIQPDILECLNSQRSFYLNMNAEKQLSKKHRTVLELLIGNNFRPGASSITSHD